MAQTVGAPSDNAFSHFRCELCFIKNVDRRTWTVDCDGVYSGKEFTNVPVLAPYAHHQGGEGFHHLPEVGAQCYVASPSDNSPAFVMGYVPPPAVVTSEDADPIRSTMSPEGSLTDISYQAQRPDMNPGDLGFSSRDGCFVIARRGGVLQLGSTGLAQRFYIPINNFIRDFAQNYEMSVVPGSLLWTVDPPELDGTGSPACQWVFHTRQYATDVNATVRVRYTPLSAPGAASKTAWDVTVAPNGIDPETGEVAGASYTLLITMDGEKTELIGASRNITVRGNDTLSIEGNATWTVLGDAAIAAKNLALQGSKKASLTAKRLSLGTTDATEPAVLGAELMKWFSTAQWVVSGSAATLSPASLTALTKILSTRVFVG